MGGVAAPSFWGGVPPTMQSASQTDWETQGFQSPLQCSIVQKGEILTSSSRHNCYRKKQIVTLRKGRGERVVPNTPGLFCPLLPQLHCGCNLCLLQEEPHPGAVLGLPLGSSLAPIPPWAGVGSHYGLSCASAVVLSHVLVLGCRVVLLAPAEKQRVTGIHQACSS